MRLADLEKENMSLTLGEYIKLLKEREANKEKKDLLKRQGFIDSLKGKYIIFKEKKGILGDEVKFIKVTEVKFESLTTDWEDYFKIKGEAITFSEHFINHRKNYEIGVTLTKELDYIEVLKNDFDLALRKYKDVQKINEEIFNRYN